jgi:hypothetical protein
MEYEILDTTPAARGFTYYLVKINDDLSVEFKLNEYPSNEKLIELVNEWLELRFNEEQRRMGMLVDLPEDYYSSKFNL